MHLRWKFIIFKPKDDYVWLGRWLPWKHNGIRSSNDEIVIKSDSGAADDDDDDGGGGDDDDDDDDDDDKDTAMLHDFRNI